MGPPSSRRSFSEVGLRHSDIGLRRGKTRQSLERKYKSMYYVYSLKCKDGFYVGCTNDIGDRLVRHENGHVPTTKDRRPVSLEFYVAISDKYKAFEFEKYLKSGSGRAFIKKHLAV